MNNNKELKDFVRKQRKLNKERFKEGNIVIKFIFHKKAKGTKNEQPTKRP